MVHCAITNAVIWISRDIWERKSWQIVRPTETNVLIFIFVLLMRLWRLAILQLRWIYFFCQITTFIKVWMAFFGLQTFKLKDFSKIYQFKVLKPKKGHSNFYKCCDLKKVYLSYTILIKMKNIATNVYDYYFKNLKWAFSICIFLK